MAGANQTGDMAAARRRFYRLAKGVEIATTTVTKQQALDVQYALARETPVDVGTARSNWRISVGRPLSGRISAYRPYPSRHRAPYTGGGSKGETANLGGVLSQGASRLATYKRGSIYVTNTLPYISPLDKGHSSQSSSGFVAKAIYSSIKKTEREIKRIFTKEFSK